MKTENEILYKLIGDVYIYNLHHKNNVPDKLVARIASPENSDIVLESGTGKILMHFLDNINQFYDVKYLSEKYNLSPVSLPSYINMLDLRFSESKYYQMLARKNGNSRTFGVVEKDKGIEGYPVRKKKIHVKRR